MEVTSHDMKARTKEPPIGWVNNFVLSCSPLDCGLLVGGGPSISTREICKDKAKERQRKQQKRIPILSSTYAKLIRVPSQGNALSQFVTCEKKEHCVKKISQEFSCGYSTS
jgi:hypothetical protein